MTQPDAPSNVRGSSSRSNRTCRLAERNDAVAGQTDGQGDVDRSMSYTPAGLFNHTAAIYQLMTGYTLDRVSPSGQLEPLAANDFPHAGCQISRLKPPEVPMPVRMRCRGHCRRAM